MSKDRLPLDDSEASAEHGASIEKPVQGVNVEEKESVSDEISSDGCQRQSDVYATDTEEGGDGRFRPEIAQPESSTKSNGLLRILIPAAIVIIIAGIWFAKNGVGGAGTQLDIDNDDFTLEATELDLEHLKSYELPIMLDFGSEDCPPCREMAPVLEEVHAEYRGRVIVKYADVWADSSLMEGFPLEVIPTQFFFTADGKPFVPSDNIMVDMRMYSLRETGEHVYTAHQGGLTKEQVLAIFEEMGVE